MVNLHWIIFEAWWMFNERAFYCFIIFFVWKRILTQKKINQVGESSPNFIFAVVNLDLIILEKRWIDGVSWPNDFVEKVNRGEDLRWVGSRCPLTHALLILNWLITYSVIVDTCGNILVNILDLVIVRRHLAVTGSVHDKCFSRWL